MTREEAMVAYRNTVPDSLKGLDHVLDGMGFFTAPASTKYHGAYEGGLLDHSMNVCRELLRFTNRLPLVWSRPESPFIIGLFHDLCKCDQYRLLDGVYVYNENMPLKGHGAKSVMLLSQFMTLTTEEIYCIRYHMGAYETEEWKEFDMAIRMFPNVLWTHTADMYASKLLEV